MNVRFKAREQSCEINVGAGILRDLGAESRRILDHSTRKLVIISNQKVFGLYGGMVARSLRDGDFGVSHWLMSDGERYKNLRTLEQALAFLSEVNLERCDAVLALGGG